MPLCDGFYTTILLEASKNFGNRTVYGILQSTVQYRFENIRQENESLLHSEDEDDLNDMQTEQTRSRTSSSVLSECL